MKTYLHLCNNSKDESIMWQVLNVDYNLKQGDLFHYTIDMYESLDKNNQTIFDNSKLYIGNYRIENTWTEKNEFWGEIKVLYLRPE